MDTKITREEEVNYGFTSDDGAMIEGVFVVDPGNLPKLMPDLIPTSSAYKSMAKLLSKKGWDLARRKAYQMANHRCEICNGQGDRHPVECHEIWEYEGNVQKLVGLMALCPACHGVKHVGRAKMLGILDQAFDHWAQVCGWGHEPDPSFNSASAHEILPVVYYNYAMTVHVRRSKQIWQVDARWLLGHVELPEADVLAVLRLFDTSLTNPSQLWLDRQRRVADMAEADKWREEHVRQYEEAKKRDLVLTDKSWLAGWDAAISGKPVTSNPYSHRKKYRAWINGWTRGMRSEKRDVNAMKVRAKRRSKKK